jgi:hypothetical protein
MGVLMETFAATNAAREMDGACYVEGHHGPGLRVAAAPSDVQAVTGLVFDQIINAPRV